MVFNDYRNSEIILAMDMVDETDCNIMVKVAGELRNSLGEEAGNKRKVRKVTTRSMVKKSESNGIGTSPEHQSVPTSDSVVVNFQHTSGEEESAVEEQSGLGLEAEQIIADESEDCDMESILQEIEEVECATKDNGIACDNPVQLVCDENTVKGRDGKVHEFEKLHVLEKGNERTQLVKETKLDEFVRQWYKLAKQGNSMFAMVDGLLVKNVYDNAGDPMQVIAVPTSFRPRILYLAHEGSGHMGVKKCHSFISAKFIWPGMGKDISLHCKSCQVCQKCSKNGLRKAPLVIQPLYLIPFECCAFDIEARGGYESILTYIWLPGGKRQFH